MSIYNWQRKLSHVSVIHVSRSNSLKKCVCVLRGWERWERWEGGGAVPPHYITIEIQKFNLIFNHCVFVVVFSTSTEPPTKRMSGS